MTHDHSLHGTEGLLSTYRHHRHSQLRFFTDPVVLCVLRERRKLSEPGPHPARLRISGGKEISGGVVRLTRIAGKVIPYPVKVDTLSACHQPFRVRSTEIEVPAAGTEGSPVPAINSGDRRVHTSQPLTLPGVTRGVGACVHAVHHTRSDNGFV